MFSLGSIARRLEEATDIATTIAGRAENLLQAVDQRASIGLTDTPDVGSGEEDEDEQEAYTQGGTARVGYTSFAARRPAPPQTPATPAAAAIGLAPPIAQPSTRHAELEAMLEDALQRAEAAEERLSASQAACEAERQRTSALNAELLVLRAKPPAAPATGAGDSALELAVLVQQVIEAKAATAAAETAAAFATAAAAAR